MSQGDKSSYTDKQKRQVKHIEEEDEMHRDGVQIESVRTYACFQARHVRHSSRYG